ncbi:MAG: helix-hairpin-helix domain-containing protein [Phototrophicaceae bacterium]
MDRNTKQLMAVFSLMLGLSWGIPYMVSESDERNTGWLMLTVLFLLLALGFYLWIKREERTAEDAAQEALDAAEENLKKLEDQAAQAADTASAAVDTASAAVETVEDKIEDVVDVDETTSDEQIESPSVDEIEELADDAKAGDSMAEAQIAEASAAPETAEDPTIEMDNDSADDSALAESHSTASDDNASIIDVLIEEEINEIIADAPADAEDLSSEAKTATGDVDLTIIEGIGPKYAEILMGAGVTTFAQIAAMSDDEIVTLVKDNGGRKSASMGTWAEQAKLAAAGDWDGLAKLQDELSGGRR